MADFSTILQDVADTFCCDSLDRCMSL